jgi:hypothetical protein
MRAHQEHRHLRRSQRLLDLLPPLASSFDTSIIPDCNDVIAGEGSQHGLKSLQPPGILMAITNEDLGTLWGTFVVQDHPPGAFTPRCRTQVHASSPRI